MEVNLNTTVRDIILELGRIMKIEGVPPVTPETFPKLEFTNSEKIKLDIHSEMGELGTSPRSLTDEELRNIFSQTLEVLALINNCLIEVEGVSSASVNVHRKLTKSLVKVRALQKLYYSLV